MKQIKCKRYFWWWIKLSLASQASRSHWTQLVVHVFLVVAGFCSFHNLLCGVPLDGAHKLRLRKNNFRISRPIPSPPCPIVVVQSIYFFHHWTYFAYKYLGNKFICVLLCFVSGWISSQLSGGEIFLRVLLYCLPQQLLEENAVVLGDNFPCCYARTVTLTCWPIRAYLHDHVVMNFRLCFSCRTVYLLATSPLIFMLRI